MSAAADLQYIVLRLIRRFLVPYSFLLRFGHLLPWWRANQNQADPRLIVEAYAPHLRPKQREIAGSIIIELGAGATNSSCYALAAGGAAMVWALEPFVAFDSALDAALLARTAELSGVAAESLKSRVRRVQSLSEVPAGTAHLVLSHSVLEHVGDPAALFRELLPRMAPGGGALHLVDYRDHFFVMPYHFLRFSAATWNRWLNPGDLPRWRLYDHLEAFTTCGWKTEVLEQSVESNSKRDVEGRVSRDFRASDDRLWVARAAVWAEPAN